MSRAGGRLEELEAALRQLQLACGELDPEAIRAAMERRGAVLAQVLARQGEWAPAVREAVRDAVLSDAREAEQVLRLAQNRIAAELERLGQGARVLRRYAVPQGANSGLDRSG